MLSMAQPKRYRLKLFWSLPENLSFGLNFTTPRASTDLKSSTPRDREGEKTPEEQLWLAVLERSLRDAVSKRTRERREALSWIFNSNGESKEVGGFFYACEAVGFSAQDLQNKLKQRLVQH